MKSALFKELQQAFALKAESNRAAQQQAYMKSAMPFWGIAKPDLDIITKSILRKYPPADNAEYRDTISYLFKHANHREEWYAALNYARHYKKYITEDNIDIYIEIILLSQWWDIVDTVADHLIGKALFKNPQLSDYLLTWIKHENMWIRRTALITQLKYKQLTDFALLAQLITYTAHEKEFFIRKAIGWALREYSKTNPAAVKQFIETNVTLLSGLSLREGSKYV